ncbi:flagellar protein FliT [Gilvimarinus xylanilyticus]|uniref:Flagellar protein FliT n=1 Tax=Gilvimarinus xylanilyticus TaxID=2944139 RepID=A0A9X2I0Y0_9GAMM|nr:flagellar protein FliT [Gilvimarinus xylanilyticus]MCP8898628.1 flagellar protein FliT [Gilvimarinus xylanilyticus]
MQPIDWQTIIEQAQTLNRQLLAQAERGEWERFSRDVQARDTILQRLDTPALHTLSEQDSLALSQALTKLQAQNSHLVELSERYRSEIQQQHRQSRTNNHAIKAYKKS